MFVFSQLKRLLKHTSELQKYVVARRFEFVILYAISVTIVLFITELNLRYQTQEQPIHKEIATENQQHLVNIHVFETEVEELERIVELYRERVELRMEVDTLRKKLFEIEQKQQK